MILQGESVERILSEALGCPETNERAKVGGEKPEPKPTEPTTLAPARGLKCLR